MHAEIIAIGSELMLGQIVDTNTSSIAKTLAEAGIELTRTSAVGDHQIRIEEALREAMARSSVVITTGGLGPTEDDLTRESVARVTGRPLTFQPHLMEQIEGIFRKRGFRMAENNRKQACIPEGSIPIENPKGTAPGFIVEGSTCVILSIPGVPSEMKYLMDHAVLPYLRKHFDLKQQVLHYKVLRATGLGESAIGLQIQDLMKEDRNPSVGTLAATGDIRIRITAKADRPEEASRLIQATEDEIRRRLGTLIYGVDEETLHGNVTRELEARLQTLALVEAFTGGAIARKLADTGSHSLLEGFIFSSPEVQRQFLGLDVSHFKALAEEDESLSEALAQRGRDLSGASLSLATAGRLQENQGTDDYRFKVWLSLATPDQVETVEHMLGGDLSTLRERAALIGLDLVRRHLLKKPV